MLVGAMKKVGNPTFYTSLLHHPHCHLLNLLQNFVNIINHSISFNTIFGHLHDFLFIILCHCRLMIKKWPLSVLFLFCWRSRRNHVFCRSRIGKNSSKGCQVWSGRNAKKASLRLNTDRILKTM